MERVLIVAKTKMNSGICVSGLTRTTNKGIRLIPPGRLNQAADTEFEVGQVWDIDFQAVTDIEPPHVEDVIVLSKQYVTCVTNMRETLMRRILPWQGSLDNLFDRTLTVDQNKCYISKSGTIPNCSTGYWLTDRPLSLHHANEKLRYLVTYDLREDGKVYDSIVSIPYVGVAPAVRQIHPGTLIRVSLARWFEVSGEKRCYLQISGWYEEK